MKTNGKPLRFAALIRVSTEKQASKGESLRTQEKQIEQAVEAVGGTIVKRYAGQEHATAGWEREQLDKLLADAQKARKPFDAVMVADASRWSRDNAKSKAGLQILRDAGVKFYTLTQAHDLFDPSAILFLGMSAEFGEFQARMQKKKALDNRIARAKRGYPTAGSLPFGRTFDKTTGKWGVDESKRAVMVEIAERYINGEGLRELSIEFNLEYSTLWANIKHWMGENWLVRFRSDDLNIDETITFRVPRLLPEKTIKAVQNRLATNRRYNAPAKHPYLLGGHIFCAGCGCLMTGAAKPGGARYYRHGVRDRASLCAIRPRPSVRADAIESAVLRDLFNLRGNPSAIERAVKDATPDAAKTIKKRDRLNAELEKIESGRNRILGLIVKGTLTDAQAEKKLTELNDREAELLAQLDALQSALANVPDPVAVKMFVFQDGDSIQLLDDEGNEYAGGNDIASFIVFMQEQNRPDRQALIASCFDAPLPDGSAAGVYVSQGSGSYRRSKSFKYEIRGQFVPRIEGATESVRSDRTRSAPH